MIENIVIGYNIYWALNNAYNQFPVAKYLISKNGKHLDYEENNNTYDELPDIHVILPAYKEQDVLPYSVNRFVEVAKKYRGNVKLWLALEEDDKETREVADKLKKRYDIYVNIVTVPKEYKHGVGKPRALNYTFKKIENEILSSSKEDNSIIGILDAEDIISDNLLDEVVKKLKYEKYDAVQGILDMKNEEDGWKNEMFRGEYGAWYRIMIPSRAKSGFPLPFGGSTNFFHYKVLKEVEDDPHGPWDAHNLTEDFDLGIRLYMKNFKVGGADTKTVEDWDVEYRKRNDTKVATLNSVTEEESPTTWEGWFKQRTRWQQGKIQTFKKVLENFKKNPKEAVRNFHKSLAIFMECNTPHLGAINLTGMSFSSYAYLNNLDTEFAKYLMLYNLASIAYYSAIQGIGYYLVKKDEKEDEGKALKNSIKIALATPLYWIPQWIADLKAIKREYIDKTRIWEKTDHTGNHFKSKNDENKKEKKSRLSKIRSKVLKLKDKAKDGLSKYNYALTGALLGATIVRFAEDPETFLNAVYNIITGSAKYYPYIEESSLGAIAGGLSGYFYREFNGNNNTETIKKSYEDYLNEIEKDIMEIHYAGKKTAKAVKRFLKNGYELNEIERRLRSLRIRKSAREEILNYLEKNYFGYESSGEKVEIDVIPSNQKSYYQGISEKLSEVKYLGKNTSKEIERILANNGGLEDVKYYLSRKRIRKEAREEVKNVISEYLKNTKEREREKVEKILSEHGIDAL